MPGASVERSPERPTAKVEQVYAIANAMDERFKVLILLATFTGLRHGEAMALRRRHLDLDNRRVRVELSISEVRGQLVEGRPKSDAGVRRIAFPASILPELVKHLDTYTEPGPSGRVFVGARGATIRRSNWYTLWSAACTAAGVEGLHFHDLRHTGNTLAAQTGASTRDLMTRMGHASPRAALLYQHATSQRDRVIADALDELIKARPSESTDKKEGEKEVPPAEGSGT